MHTSIHASKMIMKVEVQTHNTHTEIQTHRHTHTHNTELTEIFSEAIYIAIQYAM